MNKDELWKALCEPMIDLDAPCRTCKHFNGRHVTPKICEPCSIEYVIGTRPKNYEWDQN